VLEKIKRKNNQLFKSMSSKISSLFISFKFNVATPSGSWNEQLAEGGSGAAR
jgi:hypothetical protein